MRSFQNALLDPRIEVHILEGNTRLAEIGSLDAAGRLGDDTLGIDNLGIGNLDFDRAALGIEVDLFDFRSNFCH